MSRININGHVQYSNGLPAENCAVNIFDEDLQSSKDTILNVRTHVNGNFSGTSSEWDDDRGPFGLHTDILTTSFKVTDPTGRVHTGPFFIIGNGSLPIVLPFPPPLMQKKNRALLLLNDTVTAGDKRFITLYQFIQASGSFSVTNGLGNQYAEIKVLEEGHCSVDNTITELRRLTHKTDIQEVDLFVFLHGSPSTLHFSNGAVSTRNFANRVINEHLPANKLRAVYSTACFGDSHAADFLRCGFNVASGAIGINCNAATELGAFIDRWKNGLRFGDAITQADNAILNAPADAAARLMFPDRANEVNSHKRVTGDSNMTININAN